MNLIYRFIFVVVALIVLQAAAYALNDRKYITMSARLVLMVGGGLVFLANLILAGLFP